MGLVLLIIGLVGLFLSGSVLVVSLVLPVVSDGKTSWDEAMMGIVPGGCCSFVFLALAVVGLVLMLTGKKGPPERRRRRRDEDAED
jgi:hypothetical protein